jgi:hypothetical protein
LEEYQKEKENISQIYGNSIYSPAIGNNFQPQETYPSQDQTTPYITMKKTTKYCSLEEAPPTKSDITHSAPSTLTLKYGPPSSPTQHNNHLGKEPTTSPNFSIPIS